MHKKNRIIRSFTPMETVELPAFFCGLFLGNVGLQRRRKPIFALSTHDLGLLKTSGVRKRGSLLTTMSESSKHLCGGIQNAK